MGKSFPRVEVYCGISGHEESHSKLFVLVKCGQSVRNNSQSGRCWVSYVSLALSMTEWRRFSHTGFPHPHEEKETISKNSGVLTKHQHNLLRSQ